ADVDETEELDSPTEELLAAIDDQPDPTMADPLVSPNTACTHPRGFTWADDGNGHSGSHCELCGAEEPTSGTYGPTDAERENWNGTGRPRPSASTVKVPEPEPQEDKPRLLDTLREA